MSNTLEVKNLKKFYQVKGKGDKFVKALNDVSFTLPPNTTLGIVGESGCGKSTLAKTLMNLEVKTEGSVSFDGKDFDNISDKERYQTMQMVFQDPLDSLNPRKKAWEIIADPLLINSKVSKAEALEKAKELMAKVGLRPEQAHKYPHMFSGGQRQRLGIARALILNPKVLILDEPVSALDVSVQAQILNLLKDLQKEMNLSYIFISHDLSVVNYISDDIMVMYLGRVAEYGDADQVFNNPYHPYTKTLLKSGHISKSEEIKNFPKLISSELPSPLNPPSGCAFHTRCPLAKDECHKILPGLENKQNRNVSCHL
jgi:dipeptide transport system ATP-binding protein